MSLEDAPLPAGRFSLTELGIECSIDSHGQEKLVINLDADPNFGLARCLFDPVTRRWKFSTSANTKLSGSQVDTSPSVFAHQETSPLVANSAVGSNWTNALPPSKYVQLFRNADWASTPLGPIQNWGTNLRLLVGMMFSDSEAAAIYWGPDRFIIYNEHMFKIAEGRLLKSSVKMGAFFHETWPELISEFTPMFERMERTKKATDAININLFPTRDGHLEETFFSGSLTPVLGDSGEVEGYYNCVRDSTKEYIRERRTVTLNSIAYPSNLTTSVWDHIFRAFEDNDRDFPMAFAYSAEDVPSTGQCLLRLERSLGFSTPHPAVPDQIDLYEAKEGYTPLFREARVSNRPVLIHTHDGIFPEGLLSGFLWRGFGEPSRSLAILPIASGDRFLGLLTIGLNPRRPPDMEYEGFIQNLANQVSATVASAVDLEQANRREARLTQQLAESEKQIRDMAQYAPVGMCRLAINGVITWANPQFYDISGHARDAASHYELSFVDIVLEEDQGTSASLWPVLLEQRQNVSVALRTKRKWTPPAGPESFGAPVEEPAWILALAYPVIEDGEVRSINGFITDISAFKWAEAEQERSAHAAKEAKKLIERHVDLTSHEIRNPLSAIFQSADGISKSLEELNSIPDGTKTQEEVVEIIRSNVDAAKIILLCANHQRRIIDDVLTLSKLESSMLSITPVAVQPFSVVESAMKMFEAEFSSHDILVQSFHGKDYTLVDWVMLDPARLTQIFVNLLTNAIKFTKSVSKRSIAIRYGATTSRPPDIAGIHWFPTDDPKKDLTLKPEWGSGEPIFVYFSVSDTGKGLEREEMVTLFNRFQQANPRTHIEYGGSGLGLFISRQLTELQGGEIGVYSEPGKGSTFAFFVKGRKTHGPPEPQVAQTATLRMAGNGYGALLKSQTRVHVKILLVEDNVINAKVLAKQLIKAGCVVHRANHGMEALDILMKSRVWRDCTNIEAPDLDVVLMDMEMPVMDGLKCTRRIRELEGEGLILRHLHIIAITANARKEQIDTARQAGVDDVMPKPFIVGELLEMIHKLMPRNNKRKRADVI